MAYLCVARSLFGGSIIIGGGFGSEDQHHFWEVASLLWRDGGSIIGSDAMVGK